MNVPYFVCETCKIRVEEGSRWATSHLNHDSKIVEFGHSVDVRDTLDYQPFWTLPDGCEYNWLRKLLPIVRTFLECHELHRIRFGDDVSFSESYFGFEWLDVSPSPLERSIFPVGWHQRAASQQAGGRRLERVGFSHLRSQETYSD